MKHDEGSIKLRASAESTSPFLEATFLSEARTGKCLRPLLTAFERSKCPGKSVKPVHCLMLLAGRSFQLVAYGSNAFIPTLRCNGVSPNSICELPANAATLACHTIVLGTVESRRKSLKSGLRAIHPSGSAGGPLPLLRDAYSDEAGRLYRLSTRNWLTIPRAGGKESEIFCAICNDPENNQPCVNQASAPFDMEDYAFAINQIPEDRRVRWPDWTGANLPTRPANDLHRRAGSNGPEDSRL